MGDLIVSILESDDMADLIEVSFAPDPQAARASVDSQQAQVAIIIPPDFSEQFADVRRGQGGHRVLPGPHADHRPRHHALHPQPLPGRHGEASRSR